MSGVLLDTSILISVERGELVARDHEAAISVMTIAELHGAVLASSDERRGRRLETLVWAESSFEPLPVDGFVARRMAQLVAAAESRGQRVQVIDALIAATAAVYDLPLLTRDKGFAIFEEIDVRCL